MQPSDVAKALGPLVGDRVIAVEAFPRTAGRLRFHAAGALEVFRAVKEQLGFHHLSMVGGIDWVDHREVFYVVWSDTARQYLLLSADLPAETPHIETATSIWPSANWHERETWELVDIQFDHHPDLRHLLLPDGYVFHPLLRSFQLHEPEDLEVKQRGV